jgi:hypothetical protein
VDILIESYSSYEQREELELNEKKSPDAKMFTEKRS